MMANPSEPIELEDVPCPFCRPDEVTVVSAAITGWIVCSRHQEVLSVLTSEWSERARKALRWARNFSGWSPEKVADAYANRPEELLEAYRRYMSTRPSPMSMVRKLRG